MSLVEHHAKPAPFMAGGTVKAIIPQSFEEVYRLARIVVAAGMAPNGIDSEEKAAICIMRGLEVGLTPFQALDKIAVVKGRPLIWGDGALGLVRGSGLCEWITEAIEGTGDNKIAVCEAKRRGDPKTIRRTFSVEEAKKAGLWDTRDKVRRNRNGQSFESDNDSPWHRYPERMLQMRARAFCLRDGFADVLGGLYLKEEFDGIEGHARDVTPTPPVPPAPLPPLPPALAAQPVSTVRKQLEASVAQIKAENHGFDFDAYRAALQVVQSNDEADGVWRQFVDNANLITEEETEEAQRILNETTARFWKEEA